MKTFQDYILAVKQQTEVAKRGNYSGYLANPSVAQLRNLCLLRLEDISGPDLEIFRQFFKASKEENIAVKIEKFELNKFRAIERFIRGEYEKTNPVNLNLIAVLVDFEERPLGRFLNGKKNGLITKPAEEVDLVEDEMKHVTSTSAVTKKINQKAYLIVVVITVLAVLGYFSCAMIFGGEQCMQWKSDHYELAECECKEVGLSTLPPVKYNATQFKMRRITVGPRTVFSKNGKPCVWYYKLGNKIEYYNYPGLHPVKECPLRPMSDYMIAKHVMNRN